MINQLKIGIKTIFLNLGMSLGKMTNKQKILEFLESVRPVRTHHELIRLGGNKDGGYLIPNDLADISTCFSPGVSDVANFEHDLSSRGIKCFLADYSVHEPPIKNRLFDFEKKFLGDKNNKIFMTLESWVKSKDPNGKDSILQMDIEGAEYAVLCNTPLETLNKFRIIVIEFHDLDTLFNRVGFEVINLAFARILKNFVVVHIHPNNTFPPLKYDGIAIPPIMEFTFLRRDRVRKISRKLSFPHRLDRSNVLKYKDYALPECWR